MVAILARPNAHTSPSFGTRQTFAVAASPIEKSVVPPEACGDDLAYGSTLATALRIDNPELDAQLAALYDAENGWRDDDEFFLRLADLAPGLRVLDLGCGTGRLTIALAQRGHRVMGIDPNPAFLNIARDKPGAERVTWVRGTSADAPDDTFDLVLMTSHVAQEVLTDDEWTAVLRDLHRTLVAGGTLAFDTRDPAARAWES